MSATDRFVNVAGMLDLDPRAALMLAMRRARRQDAPWDALLADARRMPRCTAIELFATPVAEYAQGDTERALALLFARDGS
jgi:hypothetical protein